MRRSWCVLPALLVLATVGFAASPYENAVLELDHAEMLEVLSEDDVARLLGGFGVPAALIPVVKAAFSLGIIALAINAIAPWIIPCTRWTLANVLRLCGRLLPGRAGAVIDGWADRVPDWRSPIGVSVPRSNRLTIGIVGTKRPTEKQATR